MDNRAACREESEGQQSKHQTILGVILENGRFDRVVTNDATLAAMSVLVIDMDSSGAGEKPILLPEEYQYFGYGVGARLDTPDVRRDRSLNYLKGELEAEDAHLERQPREPLDDRISEPFRHSLEW